MINGHVVKVRKNLHDFIRFFCRSTAEARRDGRKASKVWIDALCINQENIEERNLQVKRMGQIFQQASIVFSWLCSDLSGGELVMELCANILDNARYSHPINPGLESHTSFHRTVDQHLKKVSLSALDVFTSITYWRRFWAIQEIALSHGMLGVLCGDKLISWRDFWGVISVLTSDASQLIL
jgi:hypothetical protein